MLYLTCHHLRTSVSFSSNLPPFEFDHVGAGSLPVMRLEVLVDRSVIVLIYGGAPVPAWAASTKVGLLNINVNGYCIYIIDLFHQK